MPVSNSDWNLVSEQASVHHLLFVHRCTGDVFAEFKMFTGPFTKIGHQHLGKEAVETKVVKSGPREDLITAWSRSVLKCYKDHVSTTFRAFWFKLQCNCDIDQDSLAIYPRIGSTATLHLSKMSKVQLFINGRQPTGLDAAVRKEHPTTKLQKNNTCCINSPWVWSQPKV